MEKEEEEEGRKKCFIIQVPVQSVKVARPLVHECDNN